MARRWLIATGIAGVLLFSPAAQASPRPSIAVTPDTAAPTAPISVDGSGLRRGERLTIRFAGVRLGRVTARRGSFHATFRVPASATPGTHWLVADRQGRPDLRAQVRVQTDWLAYQFDAAGTGWNPLENVLGTGNVAQLDEQWTTHLGSSIEAPVAEADGVIYVHVNLPNRLRAVSASTGAVLWSTAVPGLPWGQPPVVYEHAVYLASDPSPLARVFAFDAADGHMRWAHTVGNPDGDEVFTAPVFHRGTLYVQTGQGVVDALDPETGQEIWQTPVAGFNQASSIAGVSAGGNTIFVPVERTLYALDATTGAITWQSPAAPAGPFENAPSIMDHTAYLVSQAGRLYAVNTGNGAVRWSRLTSAGQATAGTTRTTFFAGSANGGCAAIAVDPTGGRRWSTPLPCAVLGTPHRPVIANGVVYLTSDDGHLYALSAQTGALRADVAVAPDGTRLTDPIVVNGKVVLADADGELHALHVG